MIHMDEEKGLDPVQAYINRKLQLLATQPGPLNQLSFAVKDVFDIAGHVSTAGNPRWRETHTPAGRHAPAIEQLLRNGASLNGTTITDELMYSLQGENHHYGTPVNVRAPGRIPGGSSSGSAAVAAAGLADFALGTDTGGSVRIPASYCGVYGFRPSHGAVSADGVIPLAPSFDTVGWMSRDPLVLLRVGQVLLDRRTAVGAGGAGSGGEEQTSFSPAVPGGREPFAHVYWGTEAWELADDEAGQILAERAQRLLQGLGHSRVRLAGDQEGGLASWAELFRNLQGREIWKQHGEWVARAKPVFGPGIADRFSWAAALAQDEWAYYEEKRIEIAEQLSQLLGSSRLMVIPTAPGEAPVLGLSAAAADRQRAAAMQLTCIAGLAGLPQLTIPCLSAGGAPIGLSLIAGRHQDGKLLQWACDRLREEVAR